MSRRILILDDDQDFTGLLTDIFKQSHYETIPVNDPHKALELLRTETFDLLVTDHRMPGMTGELLVRELRVTHPHLPVIVISGFLDNDTIRSLIREGVGGIFMKPLNIVNLLKRTAMLMDEADQRAGRNPEQAESEQTAPSIPFAFTTFPCRSTKSTEFAYHLTAKASFKGALTLVCPPGTPIRQLLHDLETLDEQRHGKACLITNRNISEDYIRSQLEKCTEEKRPPVLAFQNLDYAARESRELVVHLGKRTGPFEDLPTTPAIVFAFTHPVDELYERGKLDEPLYILASVTELKVPRLTDCPEDIPVLANRFVREYCKANGILPELHIHKNAQGWLREQPWDGNIEELYARVVNAAHLPHGGVITRESFEAAQTEQQWPGGPTAVHVLHEYLTRLREDYIHATLILCEFDTAVAAQSLGVAKGLLDTHPLVTSRT